MASFYVRTAGGVAQTATTWSQDTTLKATGAASATTPTAADDVFIETNSGNLTISSTGTASFKSLTVASGYTGQLSMGVAVTFAGSFRLASTMATVSGAGALTLTGGGGIDLAGKTLGRSMTINAPGLTYTFENNVSLGAFGLTHTAGTLITSNYTVTASSFASTGTAVRTWTYGTSTFNLGLASSNVWNIVATNATGDFSTNTINVTSANSSLTSGGVTIGTLNLTGTGSFTLNTNNTTIGTLNRTVDSLSSTLQLANTLSITTSLTLLGSANNYLRVGSSSYTAQRLISAATASVPVNINNVIFEDVNLSTGAGSWGANSATGTILIGEAGGAIFGDGSPTPTTGTTLYLYGANWSTTPGDWSTDGTGTITGGRVPLPQDDVILDSNMTGTGGVNVTSAASMCRNLTVNHTTRRLFLGITGVTKRIHGDITIPTSAAGVYGATGFILQIRPISGTATLSADDNLWVPSIEVHAVNGTVTFADNTKIQAPIAHSAGTLTMPANLWVQRFSAEGAVAGKIVTMTGTHLRLTGSGSVFARTSGSGVTVNVNSSTIVELTDTSMAPKSLSLNSGNSPMTQATFKYTVDAPGSTISFAYLPSIFIHGPNKTVALTGAGATQSVGFFDIQGTPTGPITIKSTVDATQRTLGITSTNFRVRYANIRDIAPSVAVTAYDSTDATGNGANLSFTVGTPSWTSPIPDYSSRGYYTVVQEDDPAWYIAANTPSPVTLNDRGPSDRIVSQGSATIPAYADPLIAEGKSLVLDGSDTYTIPFVTGDRSTDHTYEAWIKTTSFGDIMNRDVDANNKLDRIVVLGGKIVFYHQLADGTAPAITGVKTVNDGLPHHVVAIAKGLTSGTVDIYVDGVLDISSSFSDTFSNTSTPFRIGAYRVAAGNGYTGIMDELAFYRYALTEAQITEHYIKGLPVVISANNLNGFFMFF